MYRSRFLIGCLLAIALVGCRAQSAPATGGDATLNRKIELMVRSQLSVPNDWDIAVGSRTASPTPGFDTIMVVFTPPVSAEHLQHPQQMDFLLSKDGKTLERLTKWDLNSTPLDVITLAGRPVRGPAQAKVEIINYDDLQCPYCARMHAELFPETLDHYKGLVKIVYKDDPLTEIHPWALHAAIDANCLASLDSAAYWNYVDYLHMHGEDVSGPDHDAAKSGALLDKLAREEGARAKLTLPALESCLAKQDPEPVRASMKEADALKVDGTPTLFINGERVAGAQPIATVWSAIDRALRAQGITPPANPQAASPAPAKPAGTL